MQHNNDDGAVAQVQVANISILNCPLEREPQRIPELKDIFQQ